MVVTDIHPIDFAELLRASFEEPTALPCRNGLIEIQGKFYRQTIDVEIKSESGKKTWEKMYALVGIRDPFHPEKKIDTLTAV